MTATFYIHTSDSERLRIITRGAEALVLFEVLRLVRGAWLWSITRAVSGAVHNRGC